MKLLMISAMFLGLSACVTPHEKAEREYELNKLERTYNGKQCRIACDNAMKSFNPMTGECKCYPPRYIYKYKRSK